MQLIPISRIVINRSERQRRELKGLEELADSIRRNASAMPETGGLIHPIVVTRDLVLVAGERRLTACRDVLQYDTIPANFADELDNTTLMLLELEENTRRDDLSWQDRSRAIERYHELRKLQTSDWTMDATGTALGISKNSVSEHISVAKNLSNDRVATAPKFSTARGIVQRSEARKDSQVIEAIRESAAAPAKPDLIINADFNEWSRTYEGPKFNLLHCDFPYGIGADGFAQGSAAGHGGYADSSKVYWRLLDSLASNLDRIVAPSAHIVFWFSLHYYEETLKFFAERTDFKIDRFPLIWFKSDGSGILPDPNRGPRRVYETALFGSRGDRKIVGAVANAYGCPIVSGRHMSEKPEPMLRHFFRMLVDGESLVLDPTAGSGSAIRAARSLKAKHILGLELNSEFAQIAKEALDG